MGKAASPRPVSPADVVRLIKYDPTTGIVTARVSRNRHKAGDELGSVNSTGRKLLMLKGYSAVISRWIWVYCHGYWPLVEIDHQDGDKTNDRIRNMRLCVGDGVNAQNVYRAKSTNRLGVLGVHKLGGRFYARISASGKTHPLGGYDTVEEAHEAYVIAKRKLHKFGML